MRRHCISAEALVNAPAGLVYGIIADYRDGHPHILPRPPFVSLDVEEGGIGAGTVFKCRMRMLGRTQTFRATITEPEPGRVLVETVDSGLVTTFAVEPAGDRQSRVRITTEFDTRGWLVGWLQRFFSTRMLQPVYVRELEQLGAVAHERIANVPDSAGQANH